MIELRAITKKYKIGHELVEALSSIDLEIKSGEFVAVMGPSGSGKSSLMNIIGCLDRPTSGAYTLNGTRVEEMDDNGLAAVRNRNIGFVFQSFNLLARHTALENVELPLFYAGVDDARPAAMQALKEVGLEKRVTHKPNELSGGERQRVAIARAIVLNPPLILADEPTGNLDTRTGVEIMEMFKGLHSHGTTIVMVTHEKDIAAHAHRIVTMRDGKVLSGA